MLLGARILLQKERYRNVKGRTARKNSVGVDCNWRYWYEFMISKRCIYIGYMYKCKYVYVYVCVNICFLALLKGPKSKHTQ